MSTDFIPTHRTNRAIGNIKAGTPIRVARYGHLEYFAPVLTQLGIDRDLCRWSYFGQCVRLRYSDSPEMVVAPDDYVITDGKHVEVSSTDSGWDLLPARKVSGTEEVNISFHETYYCLYGAETDLALRLTPDQLRDLAAKIEDVLPKPSPIDNARYITAFHQTKGEYHVLAKIDGVWYDHNGNEYTQEQVLDNYDEIEVIR